MIKKVKNHFSSCKHDTAHNTANRLDISKSNKVSNMKYRPKFRNFADLQRL